MGPAFMCQLVSAHQLDVYAYSVRRRSCWPLPLEIGAALFAFDETSTNGRTVVPPSFCRENNRSAPASGSTWLAFLAVRRRATAPVAAIHWDRATEDITLLGSFDSLHGDIGDLQYRPPAASRKSFSQSRRFWKNTSTRWLR